VSGLGGDVGVAVGRGLTKDLALGGVVCLLDVPRSLGFHGSDRFSSRRVALPTSTRTASDTTTAPTGAVVVCLYLVFFMLK